MATQKQQQIKALKNVRLPLYGAMSNRSSSSNKDQLFINAFPESNKVDTISSTRIYINKRPGLTKYKTIASGEGKGLIWFRDRFYAAIGDTVYEDGTTPTAVITLTTGCEHVGMTLANSSTLGDYLFICDGTSGWIIKSDGTVLDIKESGVRTVTVTTAGTGYLSAPKVYFSGTGTGAAATATISSGTVTEIKVTSYGDGYTTAPTVSFSITTTADASTDTLSATGNLLVAGDRVKFSTTGTIPGGLNTSTAYYVINPTTDAFQVSTTSGGSAVNITSAGTGVLTTITGAPTTTADATADVNTFPSPHIPIPVFIDGYIALATGSDVYNCILDTPEEWSSGEYLSAEMFLDSVVGLARQNNMVVVLGETSVEFFYDAANVSGSPFARNDAAVIQAGCSFPYAIFQTEKTCMFVGQSDSGGRAVWQIEGTQPKKVSDEFIERILDQEANPEKSYGFGIRSMGHLFYVINLYSVNRTLVYDMDEKLWHEWSTNVADVHNMFAYNKMTDNKTGSAYLLHKSNGTIYKFDVAKYTDDGTAIKVDLITNKYDMDSYNRKFMTKLCVVGDAYPTSNYVQVRWTDNDYQTWSNYKTITLTDLYPNFSRLGCFRRRAFNIYHNLDYPLRLESIEVAYYEGDT